MEEEPIKGRRPNFTIAVSSEQTSLRGGWWALKKEKKKEKNNNDKDQIGGIQFSEHLWIA